MNNFNYKRLPPFKWFILENFPFIEADFDALTEWQLFCKLGNELSKVVNATNTLGTQVETLTDYVSNYFDNLDVQEEINNKLDEMADSGELENIISAYLNLNGILSFNTKADMVASTSLVAGSTCRTLGNLSYNDGDGRLYKIEQIVSANPEEVDGINLITLNRDDLYARLINENYLTEIKQIKENTKYISVKNFGVIGDGITDDTQALQNALNSEIQNIIFEENSIVKITEPLIIPNTIKNIDLNNSKITYSYEQDSENPSFNESCLNSYENNNLRISNGTIEYTGTFDHGSYGGYISGVHTEKCNDLIIENLEVYGFNRAGITIDCYIVNNNNYSKNIIVNNCYCHNNRVAGVYFGNTENLTISNCVLEENGKQDDIKTGYGLAGYSNNLPINTKVLHNITKNNYRKGIDFHSGTNGIIEGNIIDGDRLYGIYVNSPKELGSWIISNNIIKNIINNSLLTDSTSVSYAIMLGNSETQFSETNTSFIVSNNQIINCGKSNNASFYPFLINNNLLKASFKITNNYVNCNDISRFIHTSNSTSNPDNNKFYDILINNNTFIANSVQANAFTINLPFRIFHFINNYINIIQPYNISNLVTRAGNNTNSQNCIVCNGNIATLNIVNSSFALLNILRVTNETMKDNIVNNIDYPNWNGYNYDFTNNSVPDFNINYTKGSLMKYGNPSNYLYKICTTAGYGNASVWKDIISI